MAIVKFIAKSGSDLQISMFTLHLHTNSKLLNLKMSEHVFQLAVHLRICANVASIDFHELCCSQIVVDISFTYRYH